MDETGYDLGDGGDSGGDSTSFFDTLVSGAQKAYGAYNSYNPAGNNTNTSGNANTAAKQAAATQSTLTKYLPWAIGGALLLLVVALLTRRK